MPYAKMLLRLRIAVLCLALFLSAASALLSAPLGLSVLDFGAVADGKTDSTAAFQKALDAAGKAGETVFAPAGDYFFAGHIKVPRGVTLKGSWQGPPTGALGTTFLVTEGHGDEKGAPFVTLEGGASLDGAIISYPNQAPDSPNPVPYPWAIRGLAEDCQVRNVQFFRAYQGIDFGTYPCSRHYINNLYGSVLRRGVYIDGSVDVARISNVHFSCWGFSYQGPMDKWRLANCEAFTIGKADWVWMDKCFALGVKVGIRFVTGTGGNQKRVGTSNYVQISQCGIDESDTPVIVEDSGGITFSQCVFKGKAVQIRDTNSYAVKFSQCNFSPMMGTGSLLEADGKGRVSLTDCSFEFWDIAGTRAPALRAGCVSLSVQGCEFGLDNGPAYKLGDGTMKTQIEIKPQVRSAAIVGNRFRYGKTIINESKGDIQMLGNVTDDFDGMDKQPASAK